VTHSVEVPGRLIGVHLEMPTHVLSARHSVNPSKDKTWTFNMYDLMDLLGSLGAEQETDYHFVFKHARLHVNFVHDMHAVAFKLMIHGDRESA
jgi:hypothetical protein